jgi:protein-disulfide isomerase
MQLFDGGGPAENPLGHGRRKIQASLAVVAPALGTRPLSNAIAAINFTVANGLNSQRLPRAAAGLSSPMLKTLFNALAMALLGTAQVSAVWAADQAVALVGGKPIWEKDLDERASSQLREFNQKLFEVRQQALKEMIDERLLNQEASRLNSTVRQLLDREVDSKFAAPTSSDVENYYLGIKERLGRPLEEMRPQILEYLTETRRRAAYESYLSGLRSAARVVVLLAPPRAAVSIDPARVRGPVNAPITIVEFSDFECPYCGTAEETMRRLVSKYPSQIRLAYRDFPLQFHLHAEPAAEASRCASAQGKYWQYHDLLFANQERLDGEHLSKAATQLGMDRKIFDRCIAQKTFAAAVRHDLDEGHKLGISAAPTFFINGIVLNGAVPFEEFSAEIDRELARLNAGK